MVNEFENLITVSSTAESAGEKVQEAVDKVIEVAE